ECGGRLVARSLVGSDPAAAEARYTALLPSGSEPSISLDAAEALHASGRPRRAVSWYRRGLEAGGSEKTRARLLAGLVLALVELGESERAGVEIARFDAAGTGSALETRMLRGYVTWREGDEPELTSLPDDAPPLYRYWMLEFR